GYPILRMLMFGKPGAGKGTLSAKLVSKYEITSLSAGDLVRGHINEGTKIGQEAAALVAQGRLLPDNLMLEVVTSRLESLTNKHWILDGFPRTLGQARMLDAQLKRQGTPLSLVINLDVAAEIILSRIDNRWVHLPSGRVYNLSYNRPKVEGLDDVTGEPLSKRPDDNPEVFAKRLEHFYALTFPLLEYYSAQSSTPSPQGLPSDHLNPHHRHLHPHQLSFPERDRELKMHTLQGKTSDEIWPLLDDVVSSRFPGLKKRKAEKGRLYEIVPTEKS
ncbi:ADK-domain-containing protein, partial [Fistulina hepatica ATCC 64428]